MNTRKTRFAAISAIMAAFALAGCDDSPTDPPLDPVAADVQVSPDEATLLFIGATADLSATVIDEAGAPISGAQVSWSTSDAEVATVSAEGSVTAVANGSVTITASSGDAQGSADITVEQEPEAIEPDTTEVAFSAIGESTQVEVSVVDAGGTPVEGADLEWSSSDESVATVDSEGVVEAVGPGSATITASFGELSAEIEVVVQLAAAVAIEPSEVTLASFGETAALTAVATDGEGAEIPGVLLTWSSSDEAVVTVGEDGTVEAVANGEATITVEVAGVTGVTASAQVTVAQESSEITLSPGEATLTQAGATAELEAVVFDAEGNEIEGAPVAWTSSDTEVATVSETGVVEAVANGVVTITATSGEASAQAEITVDIDD
jgi:uncharacterized protein YjdB